MKRKDVIDWLLHCPASDINWQAALQRANLEELEHVLERYKGSKSGKKKLEAVINGKRKLNPKDPPAAQGNGVNHVSQVRRMIRNYDESLKEEKSIHRKIEKGLTHDSPQELGFWVNGSDRCNHHGLEEIIDSIRRPYERQIDELRKKVDQHHIKHINGNDYFYSKYNGQQFYHGKKDPRPELDVRILKLEEEVDAKEKVVRTCVRKNIRKHLIVDLNIFKEHIPGKGPDVIKISEMVG